MNIHAPTPTMRAEATGHFDPFYSDAEQHVERREWARFKTTAGVCVGLVLAIIGGVVVLAGAVS